MKKGNLGLTRIELLISIFILSVISVLLGNVIDTAMTDEDVREDTLLALEMTDVVQDYIDSHHPETLSAPEIRWLISQSLNTDFLPNMKDSMFWFDLSSNEVVIKPSYETLPVPKGEPGNQLEELIRGFLMLSVTGSDVSRAINTIRNLRFETEYDHSTTGALGILTSFGLEAHALRFSPSKTLYINDFTPWTKATSPIERDNVLFSDNAEILPKDAFTGISGILPSTIRLPLSLHFIEQGSCSDQEFTSTLVYDDIDEIDVELYAFHLQTTNNLQLYNKEGSVKLFDLNIAFSEIVTTYRFFNDEDKTEYLGKKVTTNGVLYDIYDLDDYFTGSFFEGRYYNQAGLIIASGQTYDILSYMMSRFDDATSHDIEYAQNLSMTIDGNNNDPDFRFISFQTNYRTIGHQTLIEVKAYDAQGRYVAKGMKIVDNIIIHGSRPGFSRDS